MKLQKFISYYKPYKKIFSLTLLCSLFVTVSTLCIPLIIKYITENLISNFNDQNVKYVYLLGGLMLLLIFIQFCCHVFIDYYGHVMGAKMEKDMSEELYEHIQKQPHSYFDNTSTGSLMSRLTKDLENLSELYHHGPEDLLMYMVRFVGAIIILSFIDIKLTIILIFFVPLCIIIYFYFLKKLSAIYEQDKEKTGQIHGELENSLSGIKVTKSFTSEQYEHEKYMTLNEESINIKKKVHKLEAYYSEIVGSLMQAMPVVIIIAGSLLIIKDELTIPALLTFILYVGNITAPIDVFVRLSVQYNEGISGFNRFHSLMGLEPKIQNNSELKLNSIEQIEFKNINFKYDDAHVLNNFNLSLPKGQFVALVGPSGSGKSTIANLLPRFYDVDSGQILLNGLDIRDINLNYLRNAISLVQQDVFIFSTSAYENIKYGNPDASMEDIIQAAKLANAHEFISDLPDGYHTLLGEKGAKLSGGQKQRISIARMFLKNPEIVIFDEATSALDNFSEQLVQQSLEQLSQNRTTIVIAHRLTTIQNADIIYVITKNGIVESGTHSELMNKDGLYKKMYLQNTSK